MNVSPVQFREEGLLDSVVEALQRSQLPREHLVIEITEGAIMQDPRRAAFVLEALKDLGLRVSIDDFGTGYSSLASLKRFPVDELKIDGSFVKGVPNDGDDAAIVTAIVVMAHSLGLKVVAEGVETHAQLEFLDELGCDEIQGFLASPAIPADDWPGFLRGWEPLGKRHGG